MGNARRITLVRSLKIVTRKTSTKLINFFTLPGTPTYKPHPHPGLLLRLLLVGFYLLKSMQNSYMLSSPHTYLIVEHKCVTLRAEFNSNEKTLFGLVCI